MRLGLLGGFRLRRVDTDVSVPFSCQRLLAFLGIHGASTRAAAAGGLWPEVSEGRADGSLRTTMWRLQREGPSVIVRYAGGIMLAPTVAIDVHGLIDAARCVLHGGGAGPPVSNAQSEILLCGELLPGWYEDWVLFERERLRQLRMHALEALAGRLAAQQRYGPALDAALECVRIEPLRESAHRAVVSIHLAEHNAVEALRHFEEFHRLLRSELSLEPSEKFAAMLQGAGDRRSVDVGLTPT